MRLSYFEKAGNSLREIVEILNHFVDFESHTAIFLSEEKKAADIIWHYLNGLQIERFYELDRLKQKNSPFYRATRNRKSVFARRKYPTISFELWLPLELDEEVIGTLLLGFGSDRKPTKYCQWLCESTVNLGMSAQENSEKSHLWETLRFGILHRNAYYALKRGIDELLNDYLKRCSFIIGNKRVWGTVRVVDTEEEIQKIELKRDQDNTEENKSIKLTFRGQLNLNKRIWNQTRNIHGYFKRKNVSSWIKHFLENISSNMQDPDSSYYCRFPNRKISSHIVLPAIYEDNLLALFTFGSPTPDSFQNSTIKALAILAAHAAPLIANSIIRSENRGTEVVQIPYESPVFVSYVRDNEKKVKNLCDELAKGGINTWIDSKDIDPGEFWEDSIRNAIKEGHFFIACFSNEYIKRSSTYMNEELNIAIEELRKRPRDTAWFIPVVFSGEVPDWEVLPGKTLRSLHWVSLDKNWKAGIEKLISVIRKYKS